MSKQGAPWGPDENPENSDFDSWFGKNKKVKYMPLLRRVVCSRRWLGGLGVCAQLKLSVFAPTFMCQAQF